MKSIRAYVLLALSTVILYGCASYSPKNNDLSLVLSNTQQTLSMLQKKIAAINSPKLNEAYAALNQKSATLFPVLERCNKKYALSTAYVTSLKEAEKVLKQLTKNETDLANKEGILQAITQDYDAKLQTIRNTAKNDATTKIRVTVNSNKEEGFFVFGKLSYEQEQDIKRFRFNRPTQNAVQNFVPGYYLFWLEKDGRASTPELHLIMSASGEEEKSLVLQTPK